MRVHIAQTRGEVDRVCAVMAELRTQFEPGVLRTQIEAQRKAGYQLAYVEGDGEVLCVAGFVVGLKLAWGKHVYVDDLVTRPGYPVAVVGVCSALACSRIRSKWSSQPLS